MDKDKYMKMKLKTFPEYSIDTEGNVYSKKGKKLKPVYSGQGRYYRVSLSKDKKITHKYIHRLVAETFIENPENKYSVNHIDGNKNNNNVLNLEWATGSEQNNHAYINKLKLAGESCNLSKLTEKQVREIRSKPNVKLKILAEEYNVSIGLISLIRRNLVWRHI
jgi:hypothetical protein